jgi:hypothetical protein
VPLLAPLAVLTAWGLAGLTRTPLRPLAVPLALALAVALAWRLPPTSSSNPKSLAWAHNYAVGRYREVGIWIRNNTDPAIWMSTSVAGAMPFYAERSTIDGYGLTDAYIAHKPVAKLGTGRPGHEKTDPDYVLGRRPEIIPFLESAYLWDQPTFRANYHLQTFDGGEGRGVRLYIRNDVQLDGGRQTTEDGPPTVDGRQ